MDRGTRVIEIIKKAKDYTDSGLISETDFLSIKEKLFDESNKNLEYNFDDLKKWEALIYEKKIEENDYLDIKNKFIEGKSIRRDCAQLESFNKYYDMLKNEIINEDDYSAIRKNFVEGRAIHDTKDTLCLSEYKSLKDEGFLSQNDYDELKNSALQAKLTAYQTDTENIKSLKNKLLRSCITREEYDAFVSSFVMRQRIPMGCLNKLNDYRDLVEREIITEDEYDVIKQNVFNNIDIKSAEEMEVLK